MTESFDLSVPWSEALLKTRVNDLEQQLEIERMRLAACGVVALANTPESAANARDMLPQYRSASCDDVARLVDSEMAMRQQLANRELEVQHVLGKVVLVEQQLAACERQRDKLKFSLENCRLFAARNRKESWALLILGFLAECGVVGSPLRDSSDHCEPDWTEYDGEYLK